MGMKLIVGIIAHDEELYYRKAQEVWERIMMLHPSVDAYFLKSYWNQPSDDTIAQEYTDEEKRTYYYKYDEPETIQNSIYKTIGFMRRMLRIDTGWQYLLRTNLSSLYHWDRLIGFLNTVRDSHFDVIANIVFDKFPTGCGMLLTRRAVEAIVACWDNEKERAILHHFDDAILGYLLEHGGIPKERWYNIGYHHPLPEHEAPTDTDGGDHFHIRCRYIQAHGNNNLRVEKEIPMMHRWIDVWYPTTRNAASGVK